MMIENLDSCDTDMLVYNTRDSDLHTWVIKSMKTCERYFTLVGTFRSSIWDAIGGNTGVMMFCLLQSVAMSTGCRLDKSKSSGLDEREFEGGVVLDPKPGCYKG